MLAASTRLVISRESVKSPFCIDKNSNFYGWLDVIDNGILPRFQLTMSFIHDGMIAFLIIDQ